MIDLMVKITAVLASASGEADGSENLIQKAINAVKSFFESIGDFFLSLLPGIDPFEPLTVPELFDDIISALNYFLPMGTIFTLFALTCMITLVRIAFACYLTFKDLFSSGAQKIFSLLGFFFK